MDISGGKMAGKKLGQINLEYIVSLVIFITLAMYISFQLMQRTPIYLAAVRLEYIRSESYQLSELLVNDENIGLSTGEKVNLVSSAKIAQLESQCNDYSSAAGRLGVDTTDYQFSLYVKDSVTGQLLLDCAPQQVVSRKDVVTTRRIVALSSGSYGELTVQAW